MIEEMKGDACCETNYISWEIIDHDKRKITIVFINSNLTIQV